MDPIQANELAKKVAEHLANSNDRYIMLYAIIVLMGVLGFFVNYFMRSQDRLIAKTGQQLEQITQIAVQGHNIAETCQKSLENNTKIQEKLCETHERVLHVLRERKYD